MKNLILLGSLLFTLTGAGASLTLHADLKRNSPDLLDLVSIAITVVNTSKSPVTANFPTAHAFDIAITAPGGKELWRWSALHLSAHVLRTITFPPGKTHLVTYIWDPVLSDGRSLSAGQYEVHVALVDGKYHPSTTIPLRFALPLPLGAMHEIKLNTEATVSGTLRVTRTLMELVDPTGAVTLSKRIAITNPSGPFVVRGFVVKENGGFFLRVERWARALDNAPSAGAPDWLTGDFGGQHVSLHSEGGVGTLQFDCAHAQFSGLVAPNATHAKATGTFTGEHGGPVRQGETLPSDPATFDFLKDSALTLSITRTSAPPALRTAVYHLKKGAPAQVFRCL